MRRREFLIASAVLAFGACRAPAPEVATKKRLAIVHPSTRVAEMRIGADFGPTIYLEELQCLGYVDGKNLMIDRYSAEGQAERYGDLAREVVNTHPDLIAVSGTPIAGKLKA